MFKNLFAVCLLVNDFERSLEFYRDVIGLPVKSTEGKFADFDLQGTSLAIFQKDEATTMFPKEHMRPGGSAVLGFQVDDVQKACTELGSKGVNIIEGPKTTSWGQMVAYFKDPDGNIWEVSQR